MNDMQLLELAAKAADVKLVGGYDLKRGLQIDTGALRWVQYWNPLTDDGDALRLAVKLSIWIGHHENGVTTSDTYSRFNGTIEEDYGSDPYAATRRCIVRAAAAIVEKMP